VQAYIPDEQTDARIEKMAGFIKQFMELPTCTRDIVAFRFVNPSRPLSDIAQRYGITTQAAHSRLKKALERFPVLGEVITIRERGTK
jgi:DNA-binding Lrp family transcriptional regulator